LEGKQRCLEEARAAYLRGEDVNKEKLKEYELKYETDYVSGTKSLISFRRYILSSMEHSFTAISKAFSSRLKMLR
jgi:hypothetical protein